jgi:flavodoxin
MNYILFYFSGTGNTKLIIDKLKESLEKANKEVGEC